MMTGTDSIEEQHPCFVAVDLGASSGRVIAAQLRNGTLSLREVSRFSIAFSKDQHSGYLCWNIDAIEKNVRQGIEDASQLAPITSIGVDSWGVDFILLSKDQHSGYLCWNIDAIEKNVRQGIEDASQLAPITSIGVDSWGVDFILL